MFTAQQAMFFVGGSVRCCFRNLSWVSRHEKWSLQLQIRLCRFPYFAKVKMLLVYLLFISLRYITAKSSPNKCLRKLSHAIVLNTTQRVDFIAVKLARGLEKRWLHPVLAITMVGSSCQTFKTKRLNKGYLISHSDCKRGSPMLRAQ